MSRCHLASCGTRQTPAKRRCSESDVKANSQGERRNSAPAFFYRLTAAAFDCDPFREKKRRVHCASVQSEEATIDEKVNSALARLLAIKYDAQIAPEFSSSSDPNNEVYNKIKELGLKKFADSFVSQPEKLKVKFSRIISNIHHNISKPDSYFVVDAFLVYMAKNSINHNFGELLKKFDFATSNTEVLTKSIKLLGCSSELQGVIQRLNSPGCSFTICASQPTQRAKKKLSRISYKSTLEGLQEKAAETKFELEKLVKQDLEGKPGDYKLGVFSVDLCGIEVISGLKGLDSKLEEYFDGDTLNSEELFGTVQSVNKDKIVQLIHELKQYCSDYVHFFSEETAQAAIKARTSTPVNDDSDALSNSDGVTPVGSGSDEKSEASNNSAAIQAIQRLAVIKAIKAPNKPSPSTSVGDDSDAHSNSDGVTPVGSGSDSDDPFLDDEGNDSGGDSVDPYERPATQAMQAAINARTSTPVNDDSGAHSNSDGVTPVGSDSDSDPASSIKHSTHDDDTQGGSDSDKKSVVSNNSAAIQAILDATKARASTFVGDDAANLGARFKLVTQGDDVSVHEGVGSEVFSENDSPSGESVDHYERPTIQAMQDAINARPSTPVNDDSGAHSNSDGVTPVGSDSDSDPASSIKHSTHDDDTQGGSDSDKKSVVSNNSAAIQAIQRLALNQAMQAAINARTSTPVNDDSDALSNSDGVTPVGSGSELDDEGNDSGDDSEVDDIFIDDGTSYTKQEETLLRTLKLADSTALHRSVRLQDGVTIDPAVCESIKRKLNKIQTNKQYNPLREALNEVVTVCNQKSHDTKAEITQFLKQNMEFTDHEIQYLLNPDNFEKLSDHYLRKGKPGLNLGILVGIGITIEKISQTPHVVAKLVITAMDYKTSGILQQKNTEAESYLFKLSDYVFGKLDGYKKNNQQIQAIQFKMIHGKTFVEPRITYPKDSHMLCYEFGKKHNKRLTAVLLRTDNPDSKELGNGRRQDGGSHPGALAALPKAVLKSNVPEKPKPSKQNPEPEPEPEPDAEHNNSPLNAIPESKESFSDNSDLDLGSDLPNEYNLRTSFLTWQATTKKKKDQRDKINSFCRGRINKTNGSVITAWNNAVKVQKARAFQQQKMLDRSLHDWVKQTQNKKLRQTLSTWKNLTSLKTHERQRLIRSPQTSTLISLARNFQQSKLTHALATWKSNCKPRLKSAWEAPPQGTEELANWKAILRQLDIDANGIETEADFLKLISKKLLNCSYNGAGSNESLEELCKLLLNSHFKQEKLINVLANQLQKVVVQLSKVQFKESL